MIYNLNFPDIYFFYGTFYVTSLLYFTFQSIIVERSLSIFLKEKVFFSLKKSLLNSVAYVLRRKRIFHNYVLKCQRVSRAYVFTCQLTLCAHVQTYLACLSVHVLTCLLAHVPSILPCL